jgi:hypothetical protein
VEGEVYFIYSVPVKVDEVKSKDKKVLNGANSPTGLCILGENL